MTQEINYLLNKYETKQPGECFVSDELKREYNNQEWRKKQKIRVCQNIMDRLNIKGTSRDRCINIIANIKLKELHHNGSCELIITAICCYVKRTMDSNFKLEDYNVCNEHGLNYKNFSLIVCRLCDYYQKKICI